ncbi:MAG: radical SAM family heme chaperone HemW [Pseudomonadota bacterium]
MKRGAFSVYIHVPFCAHKCPYCDFNTYAVTRIPEREYVEALCTELASYSEDPRFAGRSVGTVFFGGGTPSLFTEQSIAQVIEIIDRFFSIEAGAEVSLEANPNDAESARLAGYKATGVNRISFGVQSFDDHKLALLGRNHTADEAKRALEQAARVGIKNISLDCIFGLPGQTLQELERDLYSATALPIQHLSTYSLTIEPGTPFFQRQARGLLTMPADERVAQMLQRIPDIVGSAGFKRYEISNYAKPGYESKHNTIYWSGGDYLGIGAGAHSYCADFSDTGALRSAERWSTLALPQSYIEAVQPGGRVSWRETLDRAELMFEFFYLGMRRTEIGVSKMDFQRLFEAPFPEQIELTLGELLNEGFVAIDGDKVRLTKAGINVADSVFERLVQEQGR